MARTNNPNKLPYRSILHQREGQRLPQLHPGQSRLLRVLGRVIDGMDVVDKMRKVKTGAKGMFQSDVPEEDIVIKSVKRLARAK